MPNFSTYQAEYEAHKALLERVAALEGRHLVSDNSEPMQPRQGYPYPGANWTYGPHPKAPPSPRRHIEPGDFRFGSLPESRA